MKLKRNAIKMDLLFKFLVVFCALLSSWITKAQVINSYWLSCDNKMSLITDSFVVFTTTVNKFDSLIFKPGEKGYSPPNYEALIKLNLYGDTLFSTKYDKHLNSLHFWDNDHIVGFHSQSWDQDSSKNWLIKYDNNMNIVDSLFLFQSINYAGRIYRAPKYFPTYSGGIISLQTLGSVGISINSIEKNHKGEQIHLIQIDSAFQIGNQHSHIESHRGHRISAVQKPSTTSPYFILQSLGGHIRKYNTDFQVLDSVVTNPYTSATDMMISGSDIYFLFKYNNEIIWKNYKIPSGLNASHVIIKCTNGDLNNIKITPINLDYGCYFADVSLNNGVFLVNYNSTKNQSQLIYVDKFLKNAVIETISGFSFYKYTTNSNNNILTLKARIRRVSSKNNFELRFQSDSSLNLTLPAKGNIQRAESIILATDIHLGIKQSSTCMGNILEVKALGLIDSFYWKFSNGETSTDNPLIVPTKKDSTISLKVWLKTGSELNFQQKLKFNSINYISYKHTSYQVCQYTLTQFQSIIESDSIHQTSAQSWLWEFWKNDTVRYSSFKEHPELIFDQTGHYSLKLKYGNGKCIDSTTIDSAFEVFPARKPGFVFDRQNICAPAELGIQDRSIGVKAKLSFWKDSTQLTSQKLKVKSRGWQKVVQILESENGCITSDTQRIWVKSGFDGENEVWPRLVECNGQNKVQIHFTHDSVAKYFNIKKHNPLEQRTLTWQTNWIDQSSKADSFIYQYYLTYVDSCGSSSKTLIIQNLRLTYNFNVQIFEWNTPFKNSITEFELQKWQNGFWETEAKTTLISFNMKLPNGLYRIRAHYDDHNIIFISNPVYVEIQKALPNAFSPNGDGINDVLKVVGFDESQFHIKVYSRWGQLIAQSQNPDWIWDGNLTKKKAPLGVYYYVLESNDKITNGTFHLLR